MVRGGNQGVEVMKKSNGFLHHNVVIILVDLEDMDGGGGWLLGLRPQLGRLIYGDWGFDWS